METGWGEIVGDWVWTAAYIEDSIAKATSYMRRAWYSRQLRPLTAVGEFGNWWTAAEFPSPIRISRDLGRARCRGVARPMRGCQLFRRIHPRGGLLRGGPIGRTVCELHVAAGVWPGDGLVVPTLRESRDGHKEENYEGDAHNTGYDDANNSADRYSL